MVVIRYHFGLRVIQEGLPGYPSGPAGAFVFTIAVRKKTKKPKNRKETMELFEKRKRDFLRAVKKENISCKWQLIVGRTVWIPTCYLTNPLRIEIVEYFEHLA